jgi:hypothetical protein
MIQATQATDAKFFPGMTVAFDIGILSDAKTVFFGKLLDLIRGITIPDFTQDKNHYIKGNSFNISDEPENVLLDINGTQNAFVLSVTNLKAMFHTDDYRYKKLLLVFKGWAQIDMDIDI